MSYLYSKLPETGVSPHIDTGGVADKAPKRASAGSLVDLGLKAKK